MAGALGVRLGGRNVYFGRSEVRPFLGDGPRPEARHLKRAARISGAVGLAAVGLAAAYPVTLGRLVGAVGRRGLAVVTGGRGLVALAGGLGPVAAVSGRRLRAVGCGRVRCGRAVGVGGSVGAGRGSGR